MVDAIESIFFLYDDIFNLFNQYSFNIWGVNVSILDLILGCLILSFSVSFLWRGARG